MKTMTDYALEARERAYAPYSGFSVGAALQGTDGRMFLGCNVENASYSMTICAERNAVLQAIAAGQRSFRSIAIVGGKTAEEAREFCDGDFPILLTDGVHLLRDFLPQAFTL